MVCEIRAGQRASIAVEEALGKGHMVGIPMLDEAGAFKMVIEQDVRIATQDQGVFRAVVQFMRTEDTTGPTLDVIVGRASVRMLQGIHPRTGS